MRKTIVITDCAECPNAHYLIRGIGCGLCDRRQLDDYPNIPSWCPLPDAAPTLSLGEDRSICDELREYAIGQPKGLRSLLSRAVAEIERLNVILTHYEEECITPDEVDAIEAAAAKLIGRAESCISDEVKNE